MPIQRDAARATIFVDGAINATMHLLSCEASLGGRSLDHAVIEYDLSALETDPLKDVNLKDALYGHQIAVQIPTKVGPRTVHWGKISEVRAQMGGTLGYQLVSRMEPHHFGIPMRGRKVRVKPASGGAKIKDIDRPLIFNPTVDGVTRPNRSKHKHGKGYYLFVDELSSYTPKALRWQGEDETVASWSLADAVHYLCWSLNEKQTHVQNPSREELDKVFTGEDADERLRDRAIQDGQFLPQVLDSLLEPFNYIWYIHHESPLVRRIKFARKGQGATGTVGYQAAGSLLDTDRTHVENAALSFDVGRLFNSLTVLGDYIEVESTFELVRAWPASNDELSLTDLALNGEGYSENVDYRRVWRDWVLNESGDYNGTRDEIQKPYDLSQVFGADDYTIRRRMFHPTLTQDTGGGPIGNVQGVQVQWWDNTAGEWLSLEDLGDAGSRVVHLLERECGIRFAGELPPWEIMSQGDNAKVRVTAVLRSDKRLERKIENRQSVSPDLIPATIEVGEKFRKRTIHANSIYYSDVQDGALESDEVDDTNAIKDFCNDLLTAFNQADCRGPVTLTGMDHNFRLGECLRSITGRNIGLSLSKTQTRFPQIASITYNEPDQTMTLTLETLFDDVQVDA